MQNKLSTSFAEQRWQNQSGFTLLEILVAFTIMGLLTGVMFGVYDLASKAWESGESRVETTQRLRIIIDLISREIRSAYPKYKEDDKGRNLLQFCVEEDHLDLISTSESLVLTEDEMPLGLREVSFYIDEDSMTEESGLVMREASIVGEESFDRDRGILIELDDSIIEAEFDLIPIYSSDDDSLINLSGIDWCYPKQEDFEKEFQNFGVSNDHDNNLINRMWGEKLPLAVTLKLTMKNPRGEFYDNIEFPPLYFPLWNSREFEYPKPRRK